jgi:catalase
LFLTSRNAEEKIRRKLVSGKEGDGKPSDVNGEINLTTRQGHPVYDNQNNRTVGERGPTVLENYQFLEKITHFDRERIPERVVHARGAGAHGFFEAYGTIGNEPASRYTRAKLFQEKGKRMPVFVRFSTVIHGGHSPENLRDPRGFAVKFYTEDGNWNQAGERFRSFEPWERDELVNNLVTHLKQCSPEIQQRMVNHLAQCDQEYGGRVADGLSLKVDARSNSTMAAS